MTTVKFRNGNSVTMGKIRPNTSNYYSSAISNSSGNGSLPNVNTDSYRLMNTGSSFRDAVPTKVSNLSLGYNFADENQKVNRPSSSSAIVRPGSSSLSHKNAINQGSSALGYGSSGPLPEGGGGMGYQSIHGRSATPLRSSRQYVSPNFPAMNNNNTAINGANTSTNTPGLLFSSSQPISSTRTATNSQLGPAPSLPHTINTPYNTNNSSNNNNSTSGSEDIISRKNSFQRSQTAPVIPTAALSASSDPAPSFLQQASVGTNNTNSTNLPLLLSLDGKREWNIRDSITMPPIRHNTSTSDYNSSNSNNNSNNSNTITPTINSLFREDEASNPATTTAHHPSSYRSLKKAVRFAEPIATYEPMTNTLRNRIINDVRSSSQSGLAGPPNPFSGSIAKAELKPALKATSGYLSRQSTASSSSNSSSSANRSNHSSSNGYQDYQQSPLNSSILSINTMNNTITNKTIATQKSIVGVSLASTTSSSASSMANRPISAPTGSKRLESTATTATSNPLLSSRDQVVKKSLMEIQNRIMTNLSSLSQESELLIQEEKERRRSSSSQDRNQTETDQIGAGTEQEEEEQKKTAAVVAITNSNHSNSNNTSNNSPAKLLVDETKRPQSASAALDLYSFPHQSSSASSTSPLAKQRGVPMMRSLLSPTAATATTINNNTTTNTTALEPTTSGNGQMSEALFTLVAKSILIGNFSCRVVNSIQFYEDCLIFLFPMMDFSIPSLFSSSSATVTNHFNGNKDYSSLKPLKIFYKDLSNITLLSNKMRCRLAPHWYQDSSGQSGNPSSSVQQQEETANNSSNSFLTASMHGYLCIEFSNLSSMLVMREKIIPMISSHTRNL